MITSDLKISINFTGFKSITMDSNKFQRILEYSKGFEGILKNFIRFYKISWKSGDFNDFKEILWNFQDFDAFIDICRV